MIRFFSAVFGQPYVAAGRALLRSFSEFAPTAAVHLFTDRPDAFDGQNVESVAMGGLLQDLGLDPDRLPGQRHNAFKFALFERLRARHPEDDLCWVDADMLVLDDLPALLRPGHINVMAHGRCDGQLIACGDGLQVAGDRYAIGGLYSLPPGNALGYLRQAREARDGWTDVARLLQNSGDQLLLNHLVARSGLPVHWLTDDATRIFNLEIGEGLHPTVGDPGLARLACNGRTLVRDGRRVAVFCWIKNKLDAHLKDGFSTFSPEVRQFMQQLYRA